MRVSIGSSPRQLGDRFADAPRDVVNLTSGVPLIPWQHENPVERGKRPWKTPRVVVGRLGASQRERKPAIAERALRGKNGATKRRLLDVARGTGNPFFLQEPTELGGPAVHDAGVH